jgi:hypothetical protein
LKNGEEIYIYYKYFSDYHADGTITLEYIADQLSENKKVSRYLYFFVSTDYSSFTLKQQSEQINNVTFFYFNASNLKDFILRDYLI